MRQAKVFYQDYLAGKKKKFKQVHFEQFGDELGLTKRQIQSVFHRLSKNKPKAIDWIQQSFLSESMKKAYIELLEERYHIIERV